MCGYFVGVDVGGTKTEALIVDDTLTVCGQITRETVTASPIRMVEGILQSVQQALAEAGAKLDEVVAIGLGIPGQVNPTTGEVRLAVNLGLTAYPLGSVLSQELHLPVALENDVRLAAVGAHAHLREKDPVNHLAYLGVGTGIAVGLILNGELYRGVNGMAGEIGHIIFEEDGPTCTCGQHGCLEAIAAGPAIVRQAVSAGLAETDLTMTTLYDLARTGDDRALKVVGRVSHTLARAIQWVIMTYDVEKVVLGGGVTSARAALLDAIVGELAALRAQSELARMMLTDSKISLLPEGFSPGAHGAIRMAQKAAHVLKS